MGIFEGKQIAACFIVALVAVVYRTHNHSFVTWDDNENYLENERLKNGLTVENVNWLVKDCTLLGVWEPTSSFFKLLLVSLFHQNILGSSSDSIDNLSPRIFLISNVLLHTLNSLLLYFKVLPSKESNVFARTLATLMFAIHPQRVEVVAWASCLPYTLACSFSILAVIEYNRADSKEWRRALLLFLGITSKVPASGTLLVFLILTFLKEQDRIPGAANGNETLTSSRKNIEQKIKNRSKYRLSNNCIKSTPIFKQVQNTLLFHKYDIFVTAFCIYKSYMANLVSRSHNISFTQRLGRASFSLFWYLKNFLTMSEPNIIYPVDIQDKSFFTVYCGISSIVFLICFVSALALVLRQNATSGNGVFGICAVYFLLYVGIMLPSLQVIQHGYLTLGSDRYMYIPTALIISPLVYKLSNFIDSKYFVPCRSRFGIKRVKLIRWIGYATITAYVAIAVQKTPANVVHWSSSVNLWSHAKKYIEKSNQINTSRSPVLSEVILNLAEAYRSKKNYSLSYNLHKEALKINDRSAHGYNNLAGLLLEMMKSSIGNENYNDMAMEAAKKALEIDPTMSESMGNLAIIYNNDNRHWEAIKWYEAALKSAEKEIRTRKQNLIASKTKGSRVLQNPGFFLAYGNAIEMTKTKNSLLTAYESYQNTYRLDPNFQFINEKMAKYQEDLNVKIRFLKREVELFPDNSDAFFNLGNTYNKLGQDSSAIDNYLKSLELKPKATDALINIAIIHLNKDNCKEAIRWSYKILNEDSNHIRAKKILKRCGDA